MPLNLLKKYPELLVLSGSLASMKESLHKIYLRDIEENEDFKFRGIQIHPLKSEEGQLEMNRTFTHITTRESIQYDEDGKMLPLKKREFDMARAIRLHWINYHVHELSPQNIEVFTIVERDQKNRVDVKHTYIYDKVEKYVIVFDRRSDKDFYLLTAYYLNEPYAEKMMKKKMKKKEQNV